MKMRGSITFLRALLCEKVLYQQLFVCVCVSVLLAAMPSLATDLAPGESYFNSSFDPFLTALMEPKGTTLY